MKKKKIRIIQALQFDYVKEGKNSIVYCSCLRLQTNEQTYILSIVLSLGKSNDEFY